MIASTSPDDCKPLQLLIGCARRGVILPSLCLCRARLPCGKKPKTCKPEYYFQYPSLMAVSHCLCRTQRNSRSVVITAISIGPPQTCKCQENFIAFVVL